MTLHLDLQKHGLGLVIVSLVLSVMQSINLQPLIHFPQLKIILAQLVSQEMWEHLHQMLH